MATAGARRRQRPPELKIVLDTNAIHTQSEYYLVKHEVFELIRDSAQHKDLTVTWYLPVVVRHERQYQLTQQSLALLPSIQKLEKLLGHNLNITEDIIKRKVEDVIEQQIQELNIQLLAIEPANVDWNAVMLNAAYRKPPFSPGEKEKGFRDALIAEAFLQLVAASPVTPRICRIALVTGDVLLTEAVQARTGRATNVRILPDIEELRGLINTLVSQVSEDFVESIKSKASAYFFKPNDESTLFYRENIWQKIFKKFRNELSSLPAGAAERENVATSVGSTRFVRKEGQRVFWATRIIAQSKSYKYESGSGAVVFEAKSAPTSDYFASAKYDLNPSWVVGRPEGASWVIGKPEGASLGVGKLEALAARFPRVSTKPIDFLFGSRTKQLFKTGETVFDVTWSAAVTTAKRTFSKPVIESVDHIETEWQ